MVIRIILVYITNIISKYLNLNLSQFISFSNIKPSNFNNNTIIINVVITYVNWFRFYYYCDNC